MLFAFASEGCDPSEEHGTWKIWHAGVAPQTKGIKDRNRATKANVSMSYLLSKSHAYKSTGLSVQFAWLFANKYVLGAALYWRQDHKRTYSLLLVYSMGVSSGLTGITACIHGGALLCLWHAFTYYDMLPLQWTAKGDRCSSGIMEEQAIANKSEFDTGSGPTHNTILFSLIEDPQVLKFKERRSVWRMRVDLGRRWSMMQAERWITQWRLTGQGFIKQRQETLQDKIRPRGVK